MFITFEGMAGSGKTSVSQYAYDYLLEHDYDCILTREPGCTEIGKQIRHILLNPENRDIVPTAELMLYMADRIQHVRKVIEPALIEKKIVLCDRFFDSTIAYQAGACGINQDLIHYLHSRLLDDLKPNLTFLLALPTHMGLERVRQRKRLESESRFDYKNILFHESAQRGYYKQVYLEPYRFCIIDASDKLQHVRDAVIAGLFKFMKNNDMKEMEK